MSATTGNDNLTLSGGADNFNALAGDDTIYGGLGRDNIRGNDGDDVLFGGTGENIESGGADVADALFGDAGNDILYGENGADNLNGGAGDDTILGGFGSDSLEGGPGADSILGGFGLDTGSYAGSTAGVSVRLESGDNSGGDAEGDVISGIEDLVGSAHDDTLIGSGLTNFIFGGAGNDLISGGGNNDLLVGQSGIDTVDYSDAAGPVTIQLEGGELWASGAAGNDLIREIEGFLGSGFNDIIAVAQGGSEGDRIVDAGGGDDSVVGGARNDTLIGGAGSDTVLGADGDDSVVWRTGEGNDSLLGGAGTDTLILGNWTGPATGTDSLADGVYGIWTVSGGTGPGVTRVLANGTHTIRAAEFETIACFARGTRITTARGEVAVEALRVGDFVVTVGRDAGLKPILWLGHVTAEVARHRSPRAIAPVLIRAGALGLGVPVRDLRVSPDHALFLDGCLVPAKLLVNGSSILQETWQRRVEYWHVELPEHAVILSEGAGTESYLDDGNRDQFDNGAVARLFHDFEARRGSGTYEARACAPVVRDGARLAAIRARIASLAARDGVEQLKA